jgi:hypothetical protein
MSIYSGGKSVANITLTQAWKNLGCTLESNNITKTNGPLSCRYQGVRYVSENVLGSCDIMGTVMMGKQSIPQDSCNLERPDLVNLSNS